MKFTSTVLSSIVLASSAVAAPHKRSSLFNSAPYSPNHSTNGGLTVETHSYDSNWAGAAWAAPPSGTKFTAVSGTFNVPTVSGASGAAGAAWVGIDGYNTDSILQTGIQWEVSGGSVVYSAWHEWYPADSINFPSLPMSAGDEIAVSVVATSSTKGTATVKNTSTGKSVTASISGEALAGQNAEWIVEDFEEGSSLVPFAKFSTVTFTSSTATTNSGTTGITGADTVDIEQSSKILTKTTIESSSEVEIAYV